MDNMDRENSELADMVHFYLFVEGFGTLDFAYNENEVDLRSLMKKQYKKLMQSMSENIY